MADETLVPGGWAAKQYVKNLWITYKITLEIFNNFWVNQDGQCAGCERKMAHPTRKSLEMALRPEVDHCHKTGKVRGLLCRKCNGFLGKIQDNIELLRRLITYLQRNGDW